MLAIRRDAATVVAWATESLTVPNWKQFKINRLQISDEEITCRIPQRIIRGTDERKEQFQYVYCFVNNFVFCFSEINN